MGISTYVRAELVARPSGTEVNVMASNIIRAIPKGELPVVLHEMICDAVRAELSQGAGRSGGTIDYKARQSRLQKMAPYRAVLEKSMTVEGRVYRLGDMTVDQVRHAADVRRKQAETMLANAEWFEKIAAALEEHSAVKVEDLPDDVLEVLHEAATP